MVLSGLELAWEWGQGVFEALRAGLTQAEPWFGSKQGQGRGSRGWMTSFLHLMDMGWL